MLRERGLAREPGFDTAPKRHRQSIDQRLQWRGVIDEVKRGAWLRALAASLAGGHDFTYVSGKLVGEAWRRIGTGQGAGRASAAATASRRKRSWKRKV